MDAAVPLRTGSENDRKRLSLAAIQQAGIQAMLTRLLA